MEINSYWGQFGNHAIRNPTDSFLGRKKVPALSRPRTSTKVKANLFCGWFTFVIFYTLVRCMHVPEYMLCKMDHAELRATCSEVHPTKLKFI